MHFYKDEEIEKHLKESEKGPRYKKWFPKLKQKNHDENTSNKSLISGKFNLSILYLMIYHLMLKLY